MNDKHVVRAVFFVSDGTGLTAEAQGQTLLTQFPDSRFRRVTLPFIDTPAKAHDAVAQIELANRTEGCQSIVFCTVIDETIRQIVKSSDALVFDLFETYIAPLEALLGVSASRAVGQSHGVANSESYRRRIEAVNYAVANDDGVSTRYFKDADIVLIGVSRSGKTPLSLYLAMQYGISAANYPLAEDDLDQVHLPASLEPYRSKLFGLWIDPLRLQQIRHQRRPNSNYSSMERCRYELQQVLSIYQREQIPFLDSTSRSIEEMASNLLQMTGITRRF